MSTCLPQFAPCDIEIHFVHAGSSSSRAPRAFLLGRILRRGKLDPITAVGLGARGGSHHLLLPLSILNPLPSAVTSLSLNHKMVEALVILLSLGWGCCISHSHLKFYKGAPRGSWVGHSSLSLVTLYPHSVTTVLPIL